MFLLKKTAFLLFCFLLFSNGSSLGQEAGSAEHKLFTVLNNTGFLPKDLLSSKTLVILSMDDKSGDKTRGDWKNLADEAHFYISKLGIDPVLYIYIDDLLSGYDVKRAITNQLLNRDIKNVLLLSKDKINGRDQYIGGISVFNNLPTFIANNEPSWKSQTSDLEILFRNLARAIDNKDLVRENLMILDSPEYFRGVKILRGRRYEIYNTDLRIDRIAIPIFEDIPANQTNLSKNAKLEELMEEYPYEYKLLPYRYDEKKLLSQGCQFVLMRLTSSAQNVRTLLGYKDESEIKKFTSHSININGEPTTKTTPSGATVTKYYVKHINSGDVFLGEQWDADQDWQTAMQNHLHLLMKKIKKKK